MSRAYRIREVCALCRSGGNALQPVMSLAATPPANEFVGTPIGSGQDTIPLTLQLCQRCGHVQLAEIVDPQRLFGDYVYVSGTSPVFVEHFRRYAANAIQRFGLNAQSLVVEAGSNDGTLLRQFQQQGVPNVLGVDPAGKIAAQAREAGVPTLEAFFTPELAKQLRAERGPAALICANNVFAHAEDLAGFSDGVRALLGPEGVFMFEVSYLADVVDKLLFDTIYHEHLSYHAVKPLLPFFASRGMRLFDCERVDTHGGSLRCYVCLEGASHTRGDRMDALLRLEEELELFKPATYERLKQRIAQRAKELRARLAEIRKAGGSVAGFGAPAKLTTLMHEFGLGKDSIDFIIDDSAWKQGLYTPGTHIPVVASAELYARKPDCCVVFAWNFADSIVKKHAAYADQGGRFLVPLPQLREIP
ncbi:MAG TPA: class I SAM-dependent methyltransferase [Polyangiales bacterium]|nr:class I SAM-dependent methyltransferase [Polyangiales bacterium]